MSTGTTWNGIIEGVVAHEIVHQWIGNVITMKCFGEVWLKEGITSYFENILVDKFADQSPLEEIIEKEMRIILSLHFNLSLSLENCPEKFEEIMESYQSIIYKKGGLFTRMIQLIFGQNDLRNFTQNLLKEHMFQNIDETDLWNTVEKTMKPNDLKDVNIATALGSWTKQYGTPLVRVIRDLEKGTATLEQSQISIQKEDGMENKCWWIPISYTTKSSSNFDDTLAKKWMSCPKEKLVIENLNSSDWILINLQSAGLFVVKYDDTNIKLLSETFTDKNSLKLIPFWDKFKFIVDCTMLSEIKEISHKSVLDLLLFLKYENNFIIWEAALAYFSKIDWLSDDVVKLKNDYIKIVIEPHYSEKLFDPEGKSRRQISLDQEFIKLAHESEVEGCKDKVLSLFEEFKRTIPKVTVDDNILSTVLCLAAKGNKENYEYLAKSIHEPENIDLVTVLITAINCARIPRTLRNNPYIKKNFIDSSKEALKLSRGKNAPYVKNPSLELIVHMGEILSQPFGSIEYINGLLEISSDLHDTEVLNHLETIFEKDEFKYQKKNTVQIIKRVESNIRWKSMFEEEIRTALLQILGRKVTNMQSIDPKSIIPQQTTKIIRKDSTRSLATSDKLFKKNCFFLFLFIFIGRLF